MPLAIRSGWKYLSGKYVGITRSQIAKFLDTHPDNQKVKRRPNTMTKNRKVLPKEGVTKWDLKKDNIIGSDLIQIGKHLFKGGYTDTGEMKRTPTGLKKDKTGIVFSRIS